MRESFPIKKHIDKIGLSFYQRRWIQLRMWQLFNCSLARGNSEITWDEIYDSLKDMRRTSQIFFNNIGPRRLSSKTDCGVDTIGDQMIRRILIIGDIDQIVLFFWNLKMNSIHKNV